MKIYTKSNNLEQVYCIKTKAPKIFGKCAYNWDALHTKIDNEDIKFYFTVKNNRSYFYFLLNNQWYKTDIINKTGLDLFYYIYDNSGEFVREKKV